MWYYVETLWRQTWRFLSCYITVLRRDVDCWRTDHPLAVSRSGEEGFLKFTCINVKIKFDLFCTFFLYKQFTQSSEFNDWYQGRIGYQESCRGGHKNSLALGLARPRHRSGAKWRICHTPFGGRRWPSRCLVTSPFTCGEVSDSLTLTITFYLIRYKSCMFYSLNNIINENV